MSKESFYFTHDYAPTNDPKIKAMIGQYKGLGYGMFWRIVEMLHADQTHKLPLKKYLYIALSDEMGASVEQVATFVDDCINVFELFDADENHFWSNRVFANFEARENTSNLRSKAGKASAEAKKAAKIAENPLSIENTPTPIQQTSTHVEQNLLPAQHTSTNCNKENNNISFKKSQEDSSSLGIEESSEGCRGDFASGDAFELMESVASGLDAYLNNSQTNKGQPRAISRIREIQQRNSNASGLTHSGRSSPDNSALLSAPAG